MFGDYFSPLGLDFRLSGLGKKLFVSLDSALQTAAIQ